MGTPDDPAHLWLRDWMATEGLAHGVAGLPEADFRQIAWWALGLTADARRRAARFRTCVEEGQTLKDCVLAAERA